MRDRAAAHTAAGTSRRERSTSRPEAPMNACRDCGAPILWSVDDKGTRIPLDPRGPVYLVRSFDPRSRLYQIEPAGGARPGGYISHRAVCPRAKEITNQGGDARPDYRARAAGDFDREPISPAAGDGR
jgi:hypothetical protein